MKSPAETEPEVVDIEKHATEGGAEKRGEAPTPAAPGVVEPATTHRLAITLSPEQRDAVESAQRWVDTTAHDLDLAQQAVEAAAAGLRRAEKKVAHVAVRNGQAGAMLAGTLQGILVSSPLAGCVGKISLEPDGDDLVLRIDPQLDP